jgi:GT2 family glycosyltransferase
MMMSTPADSARPVVPVVVAVVVAHDPGPWFSETLRSLLDQDYPAMSIVVVDVGSAVDLAERLAREAPQVLVRRLETNPGFGTAANVVDEIAKGAAYYLFCHDDVMLETSTVRQLVDEALRSNAGICGPKLVRWDDAQRLLSVGMGADHRGHLIPIAESGELDQEQHDAVQDVFVIPGGCQLVRADLFRAIGAFDPAIDFYGEDLDLCWRAHLAGARVLVAPSARVRHRQELSQRRGDLDRDLRMARHRHLVAATCMSRAHRWRMVPMALVATVAEVVGPLLLGRVGQARTAWRAVRFGSRSVLKRRRLEIASFRRVSDAEIMNLQIGTLARLRGALRAMDEGHGAEPGREGAHHLQDEARHRIGAVSSGVGRVISALRSGEHRRTLAVAGVLGALFVIGSRHLLGGFVPAVGEFGQFRRSAWGTLTDYFAGLRPTGVSVDGTPPTGRALMGLLGVVLLGATGLARTLAILGPVVIGWWGLWRAIGALPSMDDGARAIRVARLAGVVVYAANPLPYNALSAGRWGAVVLYGAFPWMVTPLFTAGRPVWRRALSAGLATALAAAFEPLAIVMLIAMGVTVAVGHALAGHHRNVAPMAAVAGVGSAVALVLHLPWMIDLLVSGGPWSLIGGVQPAGPGGLGVTGVVSFHTGPIGAGLIGLAILGPMLMALLLSKGRRLDDTVVWWTVAVGSWALMLAVQRGWIERTLGSSELVAIPAAMAVAVLSAIAVRVFERDVRGSHFGARQLLSFVAVLGGVAMLTPALSMVPDGRWNLPGRDLDRTLSVLDQSRMARTLWIGDPSVVPVQGWWLTDGLAWSITQAPASDLAGRWAQAPGDVDEGAAQAVKFAAAGDTSRLGRLLGPLGVRYVVIVQRAAPALTGAPERPVPVTLLDAMANQLDLRRIDLDDAVVVYENTAWVPVVAVLSRGATAAASDASIDSPSSVAVSDLAGSVPAFTAHGPTTATGDVAAGSTVYVARPYSNRWAVVVEGRDVDAQPAFSWSMAFPVESVNSSGVTRVSFHPSWARRAAALAQAALWLAAIVVVLRRPRRRSVALSFMVPDDSLGRRSPLPEPDPHPDPDLAGPTA